MTAPDSLYKLVADFQRGEGRFLRADYNESQLRQEFVNPFFAALGWDVGNSRQVLHEASLRSGRSVKHPDYSFLAGARRVFYVETKKPAIDIGASFDPALQLRSYGWSGNTAVGILTNFAEFAVYDCRIQPQQGDSPATARLLHLDYAQYLDEWTLLHSAFSRQAVQQGKHRDLLEAAPKNVLPVDEAFLQDMEHWRRELARELHKQARFIDRELSERDLNLLVQQTIDRIVFLRIAEDRSLEPESQLERAAQGQGVYKKLKDIYTEADRKYNSGLFHFGAADDSRPNPDKLSMEIYIPDRILRPIILDLYPPKSRYQFSVIAADILGQAYERFLGNVIEVRSDKYETTVAVREKPEVRKAGGVYYTPSYIVDYIVENTVGALLDGATPQQAESLRILDPACGSGSFLTGAYQYLLDWHLRQYARQPERYKNRISRRGDGYILNLVEKRRILTSNMFGVDLDQNAVEVSKLSLLLKMLEHEDEKSGALDADGPLLPDLSGNIKWGNSLVGSDFYQGQRMDDKDDQDQEEMRRVKVFDWESAAGFGEIMAAGGFDAVIGNPPYVRQETLGREFKAYAKEKFETYAGTADLYTYFIERGVKLLKEGGLFGFIVANKWMRARYGKALRQWLKGQALREIVDFGDLPVFQQATTYPCILTIGKPTPLSPPDASGGSVVAGSFQVAQLDSLEFASLREHVQERRYAVERRLLDDGGWSLARREVQVLLRKLADAGIPLEEYVKSKIHYGIKTGFNEAFVIDSTTRDRLIAQHESSAEVIKPILAGRDVKRYADPVVNRYVIFARRGIDIEQYPAIRLYLEQFRERLEPKPPDWRGAWQGRKPGKYTWYEIQDTVAYFNAFEEPKIIYPNICKQPEFTMDFDSRYTNQKCFIISVADKYLLGILNSKLMMFFFQTTIPKLRGDYFEPGFAFLRSFPVRQIDVECAEDLEMYDEMVKLVDMMLSLHAQLPTLSDEARRVVDLQIESTDKAIDALVYRLYGMSDDEVRLVESG